MINQTDQTLFRLANLNAEQTRISYQMSTGKKIDNGSEDASGYSREIFVDDRIRTYEGIKYQIERTVVQNDASDSAIAEMKKLYEVIKTELIRANTDTTSDEGRQAIALNIESIKENLYELANTQIEGEYLFSGSDSSIKPFDNSTGVISYEGDNSLRKISVEDGTYRERGVNGYDVMTYPSSTATFGEAFTFTDSASNTIIDQDGSIWELNAGLTEIQKLDVEGNVSIPLESKTITSNDGLTPTTYTIADIGSTIGVDEGIKFEDRSSIFDLIDNIVDSLNNSDMDALSENQDIFSSSYEALNVAHAKLGAKNQMFEFSLSSVSTKLTQYNILSQEISAVDLAEVAIESKSLEITYTALYSTIQKTNELSLVNFIS